MARSDRCPNLVEKKTGGWHEYICIRDPDTPCTRSFCDQKKQVVMSGAQEP